MVMLVTLEVAKEHLAITHTADDALITSKIEEASDHVIRYLDTAADAFLDTSGAVIEALVPHCARSATLVMTHILYRDRGGMNSDLWRDQNYLPRGVVALLYPLRQPVFAS